MTSWNELVANRKPMRSLVNSAHMLECVKIVQEKYPNATIEQVRPDAWRLVSDGKPLSGEHPAHYACWAEAREAMNVPG